MSKWLNQLYNIGNKLRTKSISIVTQEDNPPDKAKATNDTTNPGKAGLRRDG